VTDHDDQDDDELDDEGELTAYELARLRELVDRCWRIDDSRHPNYGLCWRRANGEPHACTVRDEDDRREALESAQYRLAELEEEVAILGGRASFAEPTGDSYALQADELERELRPVVRNFEELVGMLDYQHGEMLSTLEQLAIVPAAAGRRALVVDIRTAAATVSPIEAWRRDEHFLRPFVVHDGAVVSWAEGVRIVPLADDSPATVAEATERVLTVELRQLLTGLERRGVRYDGDLVAGGGAWRIVDDDDDDHEHDDLDAAELAEMIANDIAVRDDDIARAETFAGALYELSVASDPRTRSATADGRPAADGRS
jgi:hypothetical protein